MKKYTKRLVAFLLATVMVLTGLPMNAKEVKAAEPSDFTVDFTSKLTAGATGDRWKVLTLGKGGNSYTAEYGVQLGQNGVATFETTYEFGITAQAAGYYNFSIVHGRNTTATINARVYVNDDYVGDVSTLTSTLSLNLLGVYLNEGDYANKIRFEVYTPSEKTNTKNSYFYLKSLNFTVPTESAPLASVTFEATADATSLNVGETATISAVPESFVVSDGVKFDQSRANYTCTGVGNPAGVVEAVDGGVKAVGSGNTTVTVSASVAGISVPATNTIDFAVAGAEFGEAIFNLENNAELDLNEEYPLEVTASLTDGTDVTEKLTVEYASSNAEVATIENGVLTAVGKGRATITATVTYEGEVKATFERDILVGAFVVDFTEFDTDTATGSVPDAYFTTDTVSKEDAISVPWSVIEADDGTYRNFGGYLQVFNTQIKFNFEAPSAGLYDLTANVYHRENQGYAAIYVNDKYVGNYYCFAAKETDKWGTYGDKHLLSVNLAEGDNTITIVPVDAGEASKQQTTIASLRFEPIAVEEAEVITGVSSSIAGQKEVEVDIATVTTGKVDSVISTTDGDVLVLFESGKIPRYLVDHVSSDGNVVYVNRWGELTYKGVGEATITAQIFDAEGTVKFTDAVTIKVVNTAAATVTYVDEDGTVFETFENVEIGAATPTIENPTKDADAEYTYTFAGWTPGVAETVTGDATYTATWTKTKKSYTVTWVVDGVETEETYEYGAVPTFKGSADKVADAYYTYTFAGWTPEVAETVTGDATYTAKFDRVAKDYANAISTRVDSYGELTVDGNVVTLDVTGEVPYLKNPNGVWANWIGFTVTAPEGVDATKVTILRPDGTTTTLDAVKDSESTPVVATLYQGAIPTTTNLVRTYKIDWNGDAEYDLTVVMDLTDATLENPHTEAISTRVDSYGELTVDGNVVTLDVTGEVPYLKNPNGVWANWIGFTVTAPEGVDATKVTILRPDGTTTTLDAVKDSESTPVVATLYQGAIPTTTNLVRTYQIDWNGDAEYDLTVVMDLTNATLLTKTFNVTWVVNGVETKETYVAGTTLTVPTVKDYADEDYTYAFTGWDKEVVKVVEADATYTAVFEATAIPYAARVNGTGFLTLEDAFEYASENGGTIVLVRDIALDTTVVNTGNVTLDLNGKTITGTDNKVAGEGNFYLINNSKGNLTITDNVGGGKITLIATTDREWNNSSVVVANNLGTVTLKAGTIEHLGGTSMAYGIDNLTNGKNTVATLNIEGGKVDSAYFAIRQFANNGTNNLNISGGEVSYAWMQSPNNNVNVATINVTGGTVEGICLTGKNADVTMNVAPNTTGEVYGTAPNGMIIVGTPETGFSLEKAIYAEAISTRVDSYGELTVDGNVVTLDVTGEVPYLKNPNGVWANWIGFTVTAPEGVDATKVTILRPDGTTTTLDAVKDSESTPVVATLYQGAIPTTTNLVRTYKIDWNGDAEYDLTVVMDLTNATLLTKEYTVTWVVDGVATEETYVAGSALNVPANPTKAGDAQYSYIFKGWSPVAEAGTAVEADATYTAEFDKTVNTYVVTWVNHDGEVLDTKTVDYGTTLPAYAGEKEVTYKTYDFNYWDGEVETVTEDITLTAIYKIDGIDEGYYYEDGKVKGDKGVIELDGNLYYVCYSGKIAAGQNMTVPADKTNGYVPADTYYFFANGVMENPEDDLLGYVERDENGVLWYKVNGEVRANVGLVEIEDEKSGEKYFYYVCYSGKVAAGRNQAVASDKLNGYDVVADTYYFYANGVMATNEVKLSGEVKENENGVLCYYVFDELTTNLGLVEHEGNYYYVLYSGKVKVNGNQTITDDKLNGYEGGEGVYYFFEDGKMENPLDDLNGEVVEVDGVLWYYVNGRVRKNVGLVKIGEDYYYVCYSGKVATGRYQTVSKVNGFTNVTEGRAYYFDAEGKMQ